MKTKTKDVPTSTVWGSHATLLLCLLALTATYAFASGGNSGSGSTASGTGGGPKISKDLAALPAGKQVDVIVEYAQSPGKSNLHNATSLGARVNRHRRQWLDLQLLELQSDLQGRGARREDS